MQVEYNWRLPEDVKNEFTQDGLKESGTTGS